MEKITKYPRTPHLEGSRLQEGDEDLSRVRFSEIRNKHLVVEEKLDGANVAVSFLSGELMLQSRGHYLRGGARERHYELFKLWAARHREELYSILGDRYIMYGEWMYSKHRVYYNSLPHYFIEFDIFDRESGEFLDTGRRNAMLSCSSIVSAPVLFEGEASDIKQLTSLIRGSAYITDGHLAQLREKAAALGLDPDEILEETDKTCLVEGLYIKVEEGGRVTARLKYVRAGYTQAKAISDGDWNSRKIIENGLAEGLDFFEA
nr:RNA ligase family protein [Clostridia bacterium]